MANTLTSTGGRGQVDRQKQISAVMAHLQCGGRIGRQTRATRPSARAVATFWIVGGGPVSSTVWRAVARIVRPVFAGHWTTEYALDPTFNSAYHPIID